MLRISNVHQRILPCSPTVVGVLIDTLGTGSAVWEPELWPVISFDRPLGVGARGGHGPIRYEVERYQPGRYIRFRIESPPCLKGAHHWFEVNSGREGTTVLRHVLELELAGRALISWPLVWRPLHDACIEDALAHAQRVLGFNPEIKRWSPWVMVLRYVLSQGKARSQTY